MSSDNKQLPESDGLVTSWISALIFGGDEKPRASSLEPSTTNPSSSSQQNQRPLSHPLPSLTPIYDAQQQQQQQYHPRPLPISPPPQPPATMVTPDRHYQHPSSMISTPYRQQPTPITTSIVGDRPSFTSPPPVIPTSQQPSTFMRHPLPHPPQGYRSLRNSDATLYSFHHQDDDQEKQIPHGDEAIDDPIHQPPTKHYGRAPLRTTRRYATKRMQLTRGNLVLENAVPMTLLSQVPRKDDQEFKKLRYTAATCDPNDFESSGFKLRQQLNIPRDTEIHIVITMYNVSNEKRKLVFTDN